jgi:acetyltransferase-like isoleucine patch superfamily enzyme
MRYGASGKERTYEAGPKLSSTLPKMPEEVKLGPDHFIDPGVLLGYAPGRRIGDHALVIGRGARIRSGTVIYAGTTIGAHLETGHNVVIREESVIGDDVSIWNNSAIDYGCQIGCRVKIHCNVYIAQFTVLEDDVFLAPGVTVANDLHPGCPFSKECMRGPLIKRGAQIGVNATVLPFVTVGERAVIGAGSVVTKDVPPQTVAYGNPARFAKDIRDVGCFKGYTDGPYIGGRQT